MGDILRFEKRRPGAAPATAAGPVEWTADRRARDISRIVDMSTNATVVRNVPFGGWSKAVIRDRSVDPIAEFVHRLAQPIADDVPEQWFKWWIRQRSEIGYAARVAPYVRIAKVMDGTDSATSALLCPSALGLRDRSSAFYCALCERAWGVLRSETDRRQ